MNVGSVRFQFLARFVGGDDRYSKGGVVGVKIKRPTVFIFVAQIDNVLFRVLAVWFGFEPCLTEESPDSFVEVLALAHKLLERFEQAIWLNIAQYGRES